MHRHRIPTNAISYNSDDAMYNDYHTLLYDTKLKGVEESFRHLDEYESVLISIPNYTTLPCSLSDRPLLMSSTNMKSG